MAFDSFKGSMTAFEAVEAAAQSALDACPDAEIVRLPMADGGEGTREVLSHYLHCRECRCEAHDALMRPMVATYAVSGDGQTAVMDMATVAGLSMLSAEERNPLITNTYGVGEMVMDAMRRGCRRIVLGIGGSSTQDGGTGLLTALGARLLDGQGHDVQPFGGELSRIETIDWTGIVSMDGIAIDVVCDVTNPLCGENGTSYVYARQKGAREEDIPVLEAGMRHFASLCSLSPETPGGGAAGGLGYALMLIGARLVNGAEAVVEAAGLERLLTPDTLVLTGEGTIDSQTLNGKLPLAVLRVAQRHRCPVVALAGLVEDKERLLAAGFRDVRSINAPGASLAEAMETETAKARLREAVKKLTLRG